MAKTIEPKLKLISEYLQIEKNETFVIPEYQRAYSWDKDNCDKLWQDITDFINSSTNDPYFFGTIIVDCSETNKFNLIDGQQRTTTFLLLLKAMLIKIQEILKQFNDDIDSKTLKVGLEARKTAILKILYKTDDEGASEIEENWNLVKNITLLKNKSINEQYKTELQIILNAKNYELAEESCYKIPRRQKENKYTNFFRNFKFFYEKLSELSDANLNLFAKTFLSKCQIIEIRSWQIEQAITMFNSLNSTGMPLSDSDIISAQLYSNAGENKQWFNDKWREICEIATRLSTKKIIDLNSVLQQNMYITRALTKEYMKKDYPDVTTPGLRSYYLTLHKELLKSPSNLCENFEKIATIWDNIQEFPVVKLLLKFNENIKLYLISYLYRFDSKNLSEKIVSEISEILLKLFTILELVDAGYSSTNFKTFLFAENIKLVDKNCSIEEIKKDFNNHISKNWDKDNIKSILLSYEKNILVFLNEYLYAKQKNKRFDFKENVNIEHIMPASGHNIDSIRQDAEIDSKEEFDSIVNKLGNKILLEEDINKSIGKDWFQTKKQNSISEKSGYKNSSFNIASDLVKYPNNTWTKDDIETATNKVADRIINFIFGD